MDDDDCWMMEHSGLLGAGKHLHRKDFTPGRTGDLHGAGLGWSAHYSLAMDEMLRWSFLKQKCFTPTPEPIEPIKKFFPFKCFFKSACFCFLSNLKFKPFQNCFFSKISNTCFFLAFDKIDKLSGFGLFFTRKMRRSSFFLRVTPYTGSLIVNDFAEMLLC